MSYNVAICTPPIPEEDESAWAVVNDLIDSKGPVPSILRELHDQLTARYPCSLMTGSTKMEFGATDRSGTILATGQPCSA